MVSTCLMGNAVGEIESLLEQRIGSRKYKLWFNGSTKFALDEDRLVIEVPNNFVGGWIRNNFVDDINQIARQVIGIEPKISVKVNSEQEKKKDYNEKAISEENSRTRIHISRNNKSLKRKLRNSLDTFIVGPSNELAYNTIRSIVENVKSPFNPLFIYGSCGLGKTHLLQGLCNALTEQKPSVNWYYVSGEEFTNQFIVAIKNNQLDAFRRQYRNVDVLVIDDVHFLANKRATQEEFLHTYNAINAAGKQVVMASDTHPRHIQQFHNSLIDRCISGMVVKINPPDQPTRAEIIRRRSQILGQNLPECVIDLISHRVRGNVREIEGAILKLFAYSSLCNKPISIEIAEKVASEYSSFESPVSQLDKIERAVANYFDVKVADIHSSKRKQTVALARAITMYLARKYTKMSFPEIGRQLGKKNHSTVVLACQKIEQQIGLNLTISWRAKDKEMSMKLADILDEIESQLK